MNTVRVDLLKLEFDENRTAFKASYIHNRESKKTEYFGRASKTSATVEIVLEAKEELKYKTTDVNIIYLSFSIPSIDPTTIDLEMKQNTHFEGVISGLNDTTLTPVSFLAMFHKLKDKESPVEKYTPDSAGSGVFLEFLRSNMDQLKIQLEPFGSDKRAKDLLVALSISGLFHTYNSERQVLIIKNDEDVLYESPKKYTSLNRAYLAAEKEIKEFIANR